MNALSALSEPEITLICSRTIPFVDADTLGHRTGYEILFRGDKFFLLYLSDGEAETPMHERVLSLSAREALLWLNEGAEEAGSFWA